MSKTIAFLGAGNIATALAVILGPRKLPIRLYSIEDEVARDINSNHRNTKYLPGVDLPKNISACSHPAQALQGADTIIMAVPSQAVMEVMELAAPYIEHGAVMGCISKGLDPETLEPIACTAAAALPKSLQQKICVMGGPAVAMELAIHKPAGMVFAGERSAAAKLKRLFQTSNLRIATSEDFCGVGYAMALKNIYAIALGMCDGLGYPTNTKAMLFTTATHEISQILKAAGADQKTAFTMAGIGDLIVTGLSPHGRNRTYGERLVGAKTRDPHKLGLTTVEGIPATALGIKLVNKLKVKAPLMRVIAACLKAKLPFEQPFVKYLKTLQPN